jgi:hypothetical protein
MMVGCLAADIRKVHAKGPAQLGWQDYGEAQWLTSR